MTTLPYPEGLTTRQIIIKGASSLEGGQALVRKALFEASSSLVWLPTGWVFEQVDRLVVSPLGSDFAVPIPVTDLNMKWGVADRPGSVIDTSAPNAHSHSYRVTVSTWDETETVRLAIRVYDDVFIPTGDLSAITLESMVPVESVEGRVVLTPDMWSEQVAIAVAAAELLSLSLSATFLPEAYGAVGDGVTNDAPAINAAVAAVAANGGGTIVFAAGVTYAIASKITLPAITPVHLKMETGGQLLATAAMTAMIEKPTGGYGSGSIYEGLKLNGGLLAERCLDVQQSQALKIKSPDLLRFTYAGAEFGRTAGQNYELEWTGGAVTGKLGGDGGTAAQLPAYGILNGPAGVTDNLYSDIKIKNVKTGVLEQGQADIWHAIHIYAYPFATTPGATDWSDGTIGMDIVGPHNRVTTSYLDTMQVGVRITGDFVRVTDCEFLWPSIHTPSYTPIGVQIQRPGAIVTSCAWYPGNPAAQDVTGIEIGATAWKPIIANNQFGGGSGGYGTSGPIVNLGIKDGAQWNNYWDGGTLTNFTNNRLASTIFSNLGSANDVLMRWYGDNPGRLVAAGTGSTGYVRLQSDTADGGWQVGATGNKIGFIGAAPQTRRPNTRATRSILSDFGLCDTGTVEPGRVGVGTRSAAATLTIDAGEMQMLDATGGAFTITLPTTTTPGVCFTFKKTDASANAVTIAAAGTTPLIDLSATYSLPARWNHVRLVSTGESGRWLIVASG